MRLREVADLTATTVTSKASVDVSVCVSELEVLDGVLGGLDGGHVRLLVCLYLGCPSLIAELRTWDNKMESFFGVREI